MKLRNKKTGEIEDLECITIFECSSKTLGISESIDEFYTIAELNEKWEDYKPVEPIIKDEAIRKAVRAWAEACGVSKIMVGCPGFETTTIGSISDPSKKISFSNERAFLPSGKKYTIAELCGEEEYEKGE